MEQPSGLSRQASLHPPITLLSATWPQLPLNRYSYHERALSFHGVDPAALCPGAEGREGTSDRQELGDRASPEESRPYLASSLW